MKDKFFKLFGRKATLASIGIWIICLSGYPFCMRYAFGYPFMLPLCIGLLLLIILLSQHNNIKLNKTIISLYLVLFCFWLMQMLFRTDIAYSSNIFQVFITFLPRIIRLIMKNPLIFLSYMLLPRKI